MRHEAPAIYGRGLCGAKSKQMYSRSDALRSLRQLQDEHRRAGDPGLEQLGAYRCRACGAWHVGHSNRARASA